MQGIQRLCSHWQNAQQTDHLLPGERATMYFVERYKQVFYEMQIYSSPHHTIYEMLWCYSRRSPNTDYRVIELQNKVRAHTIKAKLCRASTAFIFGSKYECTPLEIKSQSASSCRQTLRCFSANGFFYCVFNCAPYGSFVNSIKIYTMHKSRHHIRFYRPSDWHRK